MAKVIKRLAMASVHVLAIMLIGLPLTSLMAISETPWITLVSAFGLLLLREWTTAHWEREWREWEAAQTK